MYFQKVILVGGTYFCRNFCLQKLNTLEYAKVLVVTWAKLNSVNALLSPRPIYMWYFTWSPLSSLNALPVPICLYLRRWNSCPRMKFVRVLVTQCNKKIIFIILMALKHWFCNPFMQDDVIFDAHKKAFHQHMNNPFS